MYAICKQTNEQWWALPIELRYCGGGINNTTEQKGAGSRVLYVYLACMAG